MACVVTNTEQEHAVLQTRQNGIVVPAGNVDQIVAALVELHNNPLIKNELGVCGQRTVFEKFGVNDMAERYADLFVALADKGCRENNGMNE